MSNHPNIRKQRDALADELLKKLVTVCREGINEDGSGKPVYSNAVIEAGVLSLVHTVIVNTLPQNAETTALADATERFIRKLDARIYPIVYGGGWSIQSPRAKAKETDHE